MFDNKKFKIENAFGMHADNFVTMPASAIYDEEICKRMAEKIMAPHIYLVGLVPKINSSMSEDEHGQLITHHNVTDQSYTLRWSDSHFSKIEQNRLRCFVKDSDDATLASFVQEMMYRLNDELNAVNFEVLYVGQAYGKDGSRTALDRLRRHETLQKISLQGVPDEYVLTLLILEISPSSTLATMVNPLACEEDADFGRFDLGLDKLYNTNEAERVTLYEASLIRYFKPKYNMQFKDSFPSTNMKILADCYDKDFSALIVEICIDEIPFKLFTDSVLPSQHHIARHHLHNDEARKVFFT